MPTDESQTGASVEFSYVDGASNLTELVENSDLVVFAQPLPAAEVVLRTDPDGLGLTIRGQTFQVVEALKGTANVGDVITSIRTDVAGATEQPEPAYDSALYLLGLDSTQGSYGVPAWHPIGGMDGRVALDEDASGTLVVVSEAAVDAVEEQEALIGEAQERLMERIMEIICPNHGCGP